MIGFVLIKNFFFSRLMYQILQSIPMLIENVYVYLSVYV